MMKFVQIGKQYQKRTFSRLIINYQLPAFFFIILAGLAILKYLSLHSSFFDLGIFISLFYKLSHYEEWWRLFGGHAQPLMLIYAAVCKVLSENSAPLAVIVLQAFFLTLPGFWILKRYGRLPFLLFALYFPLWFNALFDFHMDHLAVPLLFWFYFLVEDGRYKLVVLPAVLLAFVKEPFSLQTAACGIWLVVRSLWRNKPSTTNYQQIITGLFLILVGFGYFYLLVNYVFPALTGKKGYLSTLAFSWMGNSLREIVHFIFTHPLIILKEVLGSSEKVFYLVAVFGPFLFIPFLSPLYLIPAVPILAISLLSHNPNHYGYAHHYTVGLVAPIFMAFIKGLPKTDKIVGRWSIVGSLWSNSNLWIKKIGSSLCSKQLTTDHCPSTTAHQPPTTNYQLLTLVLFSSLFFHILLSPSPISRLFWTNKVWNYGYEAYIPTERDRMIKKAIKKYIPSDPEVAVATQNTLNWGYLALRRYYFAFPIGAAEPFYTLVDRSRWFILGAQSLQITDYQPIYAQYVVLDLKRPWYVLDQGCSWQTAEPLKLTEKEIKKLGLSGNPGPLKWAGCADEVEVSWRSPLGKIYKGTLKNIFLSFLAKTLQKYKIIYEKDGFLILEHY